VDSGHGLRFECRGRRGKASPCDCDAAIRPDPSRPVPTPFRRSPTERKRRGQLDPPHPTRPPPPQRINKPGAGAKKSALAPAPLLISPLASPSSPHLLLPPPSAHAAFTREEEQHSELRGLGRRNSRARVFCSLVAARPGGAEGRNRAGSAECDVSS
jgi:hypothetical protein